MKKLLIANLTRVLGAAFGAIILALPGAGVAATLNAQIADQKGAPLEDAVVYATQLSGSVPKPRGSVIIDQVNKEFVPFVTPLQAGTAVTFPNKDNIQHQVYSFSPAKVFELKLYSGVSAQPVVFDKPGVVVLGCNIHDWMLAFVYVVDTPYFAKTGKSGAAAIEALPAGDYEIKAWHPDLRGEPSRQRMKIGKEGTTAIKFELAIKPTVRPKTKQPYK